MKAKHSEIEDASIQAQIKEEIIKEFQSLTLEEGREMVRLSGVLLLPNWDIADTLIFNCISNKLETLKQNKKKILGAKLVQTKLLWLFVPLERHPEQCLCNQIIPG